MNMQIGKKISSFNIIFNNILTKNQNVIHYLSTGSCNLLKDVKKHEKYSNGHKSDDNCKEIVENKFNVTVGDKITEMRYVSQEDVDKFAEVTGDTNPIHSANKTTTKSIVHGALLNGLVSGVIGTKLPGSGTLVVAQTLNFPNPCYAGENVKIMVEIASARKIITCKYSCTVLRDQEVTVLHGDAKLIRLKNFPC